MEGLIYGGKFAFQNRLGEPYSGKEIYRFLLCFPLYLRANSKYKPPRGVYIWRYDITEGRLRYEFGVLIFEGTYTCRDLFS